jgi:cell division septum initiation protein DivIVA
MQEAFKKVEKDAFRFAGENEKLKKNIESLEEELDNLKKDASVMRSILDRAAISAVAPASNAAEAKAKYVPKPFGKKEEEKTETVEQISLFEGTPAEEPVAAEAPVAPVAPTVEEAPKAEKPAKNRVGTMFDLLTFSDI